MSPTLWSALLIPLITVVSFPCATSCTIQLCADIRNVFQKFASKRHSSTPANAYLNTIALPTKIMKKGIISRKQLNTMIIGIIIRLLSRPTNAKLVLNIFQALCNLSMNPIIHRLMGVFKNFAIMTFLPPRILFLNVL